MMSRRVFLPLIVLSIALLGAFVLVATSPSIEQAPPERAIQAVRVTEAQPKSVPLLVRTQGTVAPRTESSLVPEVSGSVVWVSPSVVSGGFFKQGDPLLRIDSQDYETALARAKASRARAAGEREHASAELERQELLSARNVASSSQLSGARRTSQVAEASYQEAEAALAQAERDLARTEIVAPFEGRVRTENVDVGQFVSRGNPVANLYATDFAEIRLPIPDHQLAFVRIPNLRGAAEESGPKVTLRAHFAGQDHEWEGRIVRTEGEIDPRSRMVHVVARVKDPYGSAGDSADLHTGKPPLAIGLFVRAEIEGPLAENVTVVPRYVMRDNDKLLVVDANDRLRIRKVDVLRIDRDEVLIRTDLGPGERICLSQVQVVVDGMPVRPIAEDSESGDHS